MTVADVNVLLHAFRRDAPDHARYRAWLDRTVDGPEPFGVSELVLSGVLRVGTQAALRDPNTTSEVLEYVEALRGHPHARALRPGPDHWRIFVDLCRAADARGGLVADAYHAALAIEHGCEWVTTDRDFARFPGLRWRHPLDA